MMFEAKISARVYKHPYLYMVEILETLESQVWWIWVILTENDS